MLALLVPTLGHSGAQPASARAAARLRLQHAVSTLALSDTHLATASGSEVQRHSLTVTFLYRLAELHHGLFPGQRLCDRGCVSPTAGPQLLSTCSSDNLLMPAACLQLHAGLLKNGSCRRLGGDTSVRELPAMQVSVYRWDCATASPLLRLRFDDPVLEVHIQADYLAVLSAGEAADGALAVFCAPFSSDFSLRAHDTSAPAVPKISSAGSGMVTTKWALLEDIDM